MKKLKYPKIKKNFSLPYNENKLKSFLKRNNNIFGFCKLIIYERGYYLFPDGLMGEVKLEKVYEGNILEAYPCYTQLRFVNSIKLFQKSEYDKIRKYLNRSITSINMKTGRNNKYNLENHSFTEDILEIVVFDQLSEL